MASIDSPRLSLPSVDDERDDTSATRLTEKRLTGTSRRPRPLHPSSHGSVSHTVSSTGSPTSLITTSSIIEGRISTQVSLGCDE
jgi:hypothetical protein